MELKPYNCILWFPRGTYHPKEYLRKNSYEIFSKKYKTNPIFSHFSLKKGDFTKKQTQFKANSKPNKPNVSPKTKVNYESKPNQTQSPNISPAGQINFLSLFFVNPRAGYADKNV